MSNVSNQANKFTVTRTKKNDMRLTEYERFCNEPLIKALYSSKGEEELKKRFATAKSNGMTY
ncbi:hypothetical protein [Neobacillus sp. Marseille-QA0830]